MTGGLTKEKRGSWGHADPGVDHVTREAEIRGTCLQAWDGCWQRPEGIPEVAGSRQKSGGGTLILEF